MQRLLPFGQRGEHGLHHEMEDLLRPVVRGTEPEQEPEDRPLQALPQLDQTIPQRELDAVFWSFRALSRLGQQRRAHALGSSAAAASGASGWRATVPSGATSFSRDAA